MPTPKLLASETYDRLVKEKVPRAEIVRRLATLGVNRISIAKLTKLPLGYIDCNYPNARGKITQESVKAGTRKLITELDTAFSAFVRARDFKDGCISCSRVLSDRSNHSNQAQCGHFIKREYWPLRWDEGNCNAQCARCNGVHGLQGNYVGYYKGMVAKYGLEATDSLYFEGKLWNFGTMEENQKRNVRPGIEEMTDLILKYRDLTR